MRVLSQNPTKGLGISNWEFFQLKFSKNKTSKTIKNHLEKFKKFEQPYLEARFAISESTSTALN